MMVAGPDGTRDGVDRVAHEGDDWVDEAAGPVVRPYAVTHGRTEPTRGDFNLITQVTATRTLRDGDDGRQPEHAAILRLCQNPTSVAEIATHLDLPVGTVRVLLGDLL